MGSYIFPKWSSGPWTSNKLWILFDVYEIKNIAQLYSVTNSSLEVESKDEHFKFLAPNDIVENVSHIWDTQETILSRAAQKIKAGTGAVADFGNLLSSTLQSLGITSGSKINGDKLGNILQSNAYLRGKVDSPLMYKDSQRREFSFSLELMAYTGSTSILECVRQLESFSSPGMDGTETIWPYIFNLYTEPSGVIFVENAALVNVQASFHYPFLSSGEPTKCDLSLTFREIDPLYDNNFEEDYPEINISETTNEEVETNTGT